MTNNKQYRSPKQYIIGSTWFNLMNGKIIGIILMNNGYEDKAYIGIGEGIDQRDDETMIINSGTPFPINQAKEIIQPEK